MPQSQRLSSVIPFVAIERHACPKCKAQMMLVSIAQCAPRVVGRTAGASLFNERCVLMSL